jgi:hypothetical protein
MKVDQKRIFSLKNGNRLHVRKVSSSLFVLDIQEIFRFFLSFGPVTFLKRTANGMIFFPMLSVRKLIFPGVPLTIGVCIFSYLNNNQDIITIATTTLIILVSLQIFLMPVHFWVVKRDLRKNPG